MLSFTLFILLSIGTNYMTIPMSLGKLVSYPFYRTWVTAKGLSYIILSKTAIPYLGLH